MKRILLLTIFITILGNCFAQEEERETKHLITGALGYTYIPSAGAVGSSESEGVFVPSIGLDYFYSVAKQWEVGIMSDLELGEYVLINKDLNRENALVIAAIAVYSPIKSVNIFAGGGIEIEKHHNLGILRLGTEYEFELKRNWVISPGIFFDFKEGVDTWSLSIAFGKKF